MPIPAIHIETVTGNAESLPTTTAEIITNGLSNLNLNPGAAEIFGIVSALALLLLAAFLANLLAKRAIAHILHPLILKTPNKWDDQLVNEAVLVRLSHLVPAAVIHALTPAMVGSAPGLVTYINLLLNLYLIIITLFVLDGVINFFRALWESRPVGRRYPAKSFAQALKLVINLIGVILILATLLDRSPVVFFSGLGAVTAILLLIFKDAILGLVAGFQLSINNMVSVGDWIEMPGRGADGDVIDVSLTTVKVQNWDRTITTIPSYALISDSFKNWRGMSESGGRRIKRAFHIDLRTIRFADEELLERFKRIRLLRPYLEQKLEDIQKYNKDVGDDLSELINGRRLTNIGTFRAYCVAYLRNHPKVHNELIQLVRQLPPTATGLPLEVYVFTNEIAWVKYEDIQSDIFDHLLSILPEFHLSAFQSPSGADLEKAGSPLADLLSRKPTE